ncbi:UxaA family hydrolase [Asticcacaulis tiandongensis]|uniref:UxaA family hydrolase n=1 Tax=Asticcacaulis tiandongensis TaxID=2565365 RepID=UPI00112AA1F5|nr:UxaA family hydrolase [Asticcacaulis tiandongensis]
MDKETNVRVSSDLILLHDHDNVLVCRQVIEPGVRLVIDGAEVVAGERIEVGHKVARRDLSVGDKIIKYGAPIGSMTGAAPKGGHVHLHNMKSDYIPSHTRKVVG